MLIPTERRTSYRVDGEASMSRIQAAPITELIFAWVRSENRLERSDIRKELKRRGGERVATCPALHETGETLKRGVA